MDSALFKDVDDGGIPVFVSLAGYDESGAVSLTFVKDGRLSADNMPSIKTAPVANYSGATEPWFTLKNGDSGWDWATFDGNSVMNLYTLIGGAYAETNGVALAAGMAAMLCELSYDGDRVVVAVKDFAAHSPDDPPTAWWQTDPEWHTKLPMVTSDKRSMANRFVAAFPTSALAAAPADSLKAMFAAMSWGVLHKDPDVEAFDVVLDFDNSSAKISPGAGMGAAEFASGTSYAGVSVRGPGAVSVERVSNFPDIFSAPAVEPDGSFPGGAPSGPSPGDAPAIPPWALPDFNLALPDRRANSYAVPLAAATVLFPVISAFAQGQWSWGSFIVGLVASLAVFAVLFLDSVFSGVYGTNVTAAFAPSLVRRRVAQTFAVV